MQEYIWIVWDLAAVAILVYFIGAGASRGLVRTVVSLAGYVAALVVARLGSPILAQFLYDHVVHDAIRIVLEGRLEELLAGGAAAGELVEAIPEGLRRIMGDGVSGIAGDAARTEAGRLIEAIIDEALREPVLAILQGFLFLLLFTLTLLVVRRVSRLFGGINRIPLVGTFNTLLGGVLGVAQAALALAILSLALQLIILFTGGWFWLNPQVMDDTFILRVFYSWLT